MPTLLAGEQATGAVGNIRVSPDGSKVAVVNDTGRGVNVLDVATSQRLFAFGDEPGSVWWLAWSSDSTRLAVSRSEGDICIWDLAKAQAVLTEAGLAGTIAAPVKNDKD